MAAYVGPCWMVTVKNHPVLAVVCLDRDALESLRGLYERTYGAEKVSVTPMNAQASKPNIVSAVNV